VASKVTCKVTLGGLNFYPLVLIFFLRVFLSFYFTRLDQFLMGRLVDELGVPIDALLMREGQRVAVDSLINSRAEADTTHRLFCVSLQVPRCVFVELLIDDMPISDRTHGSICTQTCLDCCNVIVSLLA
jgi:hypothetical protein